MGDYMGDYSGDKTWGLGCLNSYSN
jgi:hypothetical protein